jgi:hypothetical protein
MLRLFFCDFFCVKKKTAQTCAFGPTIQTDPADPVPGKNTFLKPGPRVDSNKNRHMLFHVDA